MSVWYTVTVGWLAWYVVTARGSISTAAATVKPDWARPVVRPPQPENRSRATGVGEAAEREAGGRRRVGGVGVTALTGWSR